MENKPVIILGGGLWGSLLAYRLKMALPHIPFKIYERTSTLGGHESYTFHGSDIESAAKVWLRPLITQTWSSHRVRFPKYEKVLDNSFHLISSDQLHAVIIDSLKADQVCLNNEISANLALKEASFVIDTRNICGYKKCGFQKFLAMDIELDNTHGLVEPELIGCTQYLPLSSHRLLIKDQRYSENADLNFDEMKQNLMKVIALNNWKVTRVLREEMRTRKIPVTTPHFRQEGRVINLAGIFHDTTGNSIPAATRLIDQMVATSFRLGEVKEVVSSFRKETEGDRKFLRYLNRDLIHTVPEKQHVFFQDIYKLPKPILESFLRGRLSLIDRSRILLSNYLFQKD